MSSSKRASAAGLLAMVAALTGCSADVTRFRLGGDATFFPFLPTGRGDLTKKEGGPELQKTATPPPVGPAPKYKVVGRDYGPPPADKTPPPIVPVIKPPEAPPASPAETVEVKAGETLYHIAKRHGVAVAAIKDRNGLTSDALKPGQRLLLPATAKGPGPQAKAPPATAEKKHKDEPAGDPTLRQPPRVVQVKTRIIAAGPEAAKAEPLQKTAKRGDIVTDALPPPATAKFRWPARGKTIVAFGAQPDGTKSDGISLALALGTEVYAAEAGRVSYVGDGLKSYGNLVLIRHDGDWTTAYAHLDRILVKPGEQVKRGQLIAKAGKSGPVAAPQLRFELRKSTVPVDPLAHLAD